VLGHYVLVFIDFAGGWVRFEKGFKTLVFRSTHKVFDEKPEIAFNMRRG
jgi:hypothetical protein